MLLLSAFCPISLLLYTINCGARTPTKLFPFSHHNYIIIAYNLYIFARNFHVKCAPARRQEGDSHRAKGTFLTFNQKRAVVGRAEWAKYFVSLCRVAWCIQGWMELPSRLAGIWIFYPSRYVIGTQTSIWLSWLYKHHARRCRFNEVSIVTYIRLVDMYIFCGTLAIYGIIKYIYTF